MLTSLPGSLLPAVLDTVLGSAQASMSEVVGGILPSAASDSAAALGRAIIFGSLSDSSTTPIDGAGSFAFDVVPLLVVAMVVAAFATAIVIAALRRRERDE